MLGSIQYVGETEGGFNSYTYLDAVTKLWMFALLTRHSLIVAMF